MIIFGRFVLGLVITGLGGLLWTAQASSTPALVLAERELGSDYLIVTPDEALPAERTAAIELKAYLGRVTGAEFAIAKETEIAGPASQYPLQLFVGPTKAFAEAFPEVDLASLGHDGIVIKTKDDRLFLAGGRPRGTLYAVYTFLEEVVGVRWWGSRPDEETVPSIPALEIPPLDLVYVPTLQYREAFYRGAFDGVYAARSKCNGHFERIPVEYGGHYNLIGWCHTFYPFLPPEKYFADHPEWYSEINGQRVGEWAQLCLTNQEMRAQFIQNVLELLRQDPSAGLISVAQNDWGGACQCENCRKLAEQEGSESGPLIDFVNAVAEAVEKEFPDFMVETLAYQYTRKPPLHIKPRDNVVVRLCSIECSFAQPLVDGPQNVQFANDIKGWSALAPHLYIWDYVTNFPAYILPHPNMHVLAPNIRFFVDNHTIGLFEQGDAGCSISDFPELRAWLLAHLMWDPSKDDKALIREFLEGYYGEAAEPLENYINLICDAVQQSGVYLPCFYTDTSGWLGFKEMTEATRLFDEALARVQDSELLTQRVKRARMPLDHVWLLRYNALRRSAQFLGVPFEGPQDPVALCKEFLQLAKDFDAGQYREGRPFEEYEPSLLSRWMGNSVDGSPATKPKEAEGTGEYDWADFQEQDMSLHNVGGWVQLVEEPAASNGLVAKMGADHTQWAVQCPILAEMAATGPWHCYVVLRCEALSEEGNAFSLGLYDATQNQGLIQQTITIPQALGEVELAEGAIKTTPTTSGGFVTYDLGIWDLKPGMYFWVAPQANPDQMSAVCVDRFFFVKK